GGRLPFLVGGHGAGAVVHGIAILDVEAVAANVGGLGRGLVGASRYVGAAEIGRQPGVVGAALGGLVYFGVQLGAELGIGLHLLQRGVELGALFRLAHGRVVFGIDDVGDRPPAGI